MKNEGALRSVFSGMTESIGPMCRHICLPLGRVPFPVGPLPGYRTRRKERALPIVRDEFRPAIPRRVARQHCPSPLHRHHQLKTIAASKEMIYHRTVNSLLTVCLTHRDNPSTTLGLSRPARASLALRPPRSQPAQRRTLVPRHRPDQLPNRTARQLPCPTDNYTRGSSFHK